MWKSYDAIIKSVLSSDNLTKEDLVSIAEGHRKYVRYIFNDYEFDTNEEYLKSENDYRELEEIQKKFSDFYYNEVFLNGYSLSIEDIARYLDVSVRYVTSSIIPNLDRIEFPTGNQHLKYLIKNNIHNKVFGENKYASAKEYHFDSKLRISDFYDIFRKKILYNVDSFVRFLNQNTFYQLKDKVLISINIPKYLFNDINDTPSKYLEKFSKVFIKRYQVKVNSLPLNTVISFEYIKSKFDLKYLPILNSSSNEVLENDTLKNSQIKSANSLSTIFNTVYLIQVMRKVKAIKDIIPFELHIKGSKSPLVRFFITEEELISEFKLGLLESSTDVAGVDSDIDEDNIEISPCVENLKFIIELPRIIFHDKFKNNSLILENEFIDKLILKIKEDVAL